MNQAGIDKIEKYRKLLKWAEKNRAENKNEALRLYKDLLIVYEYTKENLRNWFDEDIYKSYKRISKRYKIKDVSLRSCDYKCKLERYIRWIYCIQEFISADFCEDNIKETERKICDRKCFLSRDEDWYNVHGCCQSGIIHSQEDIDRMKTLGIEFPYKLIPTFLEWVILGGCLFWGKKGCKLSIECRPKECLEYVCDQERLKK